MNKTKAPIVIFTPKLPKLSRNEKDVLKLLIEAGKLIAPLYSEQENQKYPGANFYPHGISREEITAAAKSNPAILSPYTVVEKKNGKLIAVPYHQKYAKFLKPISEKLLQASRLTKNKEFAARLKVQAEALFDGSYDKAVLSWMSMKPYVIDINIGPIERYDDKLLFIKTSYQAWVGVMDKDKTERLNEYQKIILSVQRNIAIASDKVDYYDKVQVRADETLLFAGLIARTMFVGVNLPNDPVLTEQHGSEITIFKEVNQFRFQHEILPDFKKIFSPQFKKLYTLSELENGCLYLVVLHELAHTYLRFRGAEKRLQDLFPVIDELAAYVTGVKVCGSLLLKDIATPKQLESIMVVLVARSFHLALHEKNNVSKLHYIIGGTILLNYLLESGAIKMAGGISWPNFMKMFVSFDQLSAILGRLLARGTRSDAEAFIKKYNNIENLIKI